jgi:archaellin
MTVPKQTNHRKALWHFSETRLLFGLACAVGLFGGWTAPSRANAGAVSQDETVDFRFSPPEWQTLICLPDDPCKSLVDKSGALLYHYNQGGREFGTTIAVEVVSNAVWQNQELQSPRIPIVRTHLAADGLKIDEEAFADTDFGRPVTHKNSSLFRLDDGITAWNWAHPEGNVDAALGDIALHDNGSLHFEAAGASRRVAVALSEGWWDQPGKRVEVVRVEGAAPKTVDLAADIGKNKAAVFWFDARDTNGDGKIEIQVDAAGNSFDKTTILNGLWVFPADAAENDEELLSGKLNGNALGWLDPASGSSRNDLVLVHVSNTGSETRTLAPKVIIDTALGCQFQGRRVVVNNHETVTSSLQMTGMTGGKQVQLENMTVPAGKTVTFSVVYSGGGKIALKPATLKGAMAARNHAVKYWEKAPLPYGKVQIPDPGIQALIDSAIRNIWQARDIKKGIPVFQVGPTIYRQLWIVDGAFLLETAALLGAGDQARNAIAYTLSQQKPTGAFEVLSPEYYKENGIVIWTCIRHAMLTQDKAWLESVWPQLEKSASYIKELRKRSLKDGIALDDGLIPPGEIDGGLAGWQSGFKHPEFSSVYWNLAGLRALIQAANWLGKTDDAAAWQKEYDDFYATFRKAASRDTQRDSHGNPYVPIFMGNWNHELPQRGQWSFCHAVYPGQIFAKGDPLVAGNLAMLKATEHEGMVYGTGWDATGIWTYFASFYAHAWLWQGDGQKALRLLYAFANHAAPVLDWREEQALKGEPYKKVGDMPHNWASAEFIRLTIHLLEIDRNDELHLFEGMPAKWAQAGMVTRLNGIATPFGKLTMELKVADDGKTASLKVKPLSGGSCKKIVVHLAGWASNSPDASIELDPIKSNDRTILLTLNSAMPKQQ